MTPLTAVAVDRRTVGVVLTRLPSGTPVALRPIAPDDKARLSAAMEHVSDESLRRRFLTSKPRLTGSDLRYLTEVDLLDHYAEVAVLADQPDAIVGVARWVRDPQAPQEAEVAVIVGDAFHGQGLGTLLGESIADAARERGVRRFTATLLGDNEAAHRLFARISERLHVRHDGPLDEIVAELAA